MTRSGAGFCPSLSPGHSVWNAALWGVASKTGNFASPGTTINKVERRDPFFSWWSVFFFFSSWCFIIDVLFFPNILRSWTTFHVFFGKSFCGTKPLRSWCFYTPCVGCEVFNPLAEQAQRLHEDFLRLQQKGMQLANGQLMLEATAGYGHVMVGFPNKPMGFSMVKNDQHVLGYEMGGRVFHHLL